jgi:4-amino-4-deoxy-L-arabinose transferase-like glycosyltransferase
MASVAPAAPPTLPEPASPVSPKNLWRKLVHSRAGPCILLAGWSGLLFFYGLWASELWRTESLRAIIAQEMLRSGNWIVPTLYGEPLFTKPPGFYAAIALFSLPFGQVTEWTARLPSAIGATVTVFLFYWFISRYTNRTAGLIAALILPMGPMWLDKASAAEIDMLQVAWVTASLVFFFRALEQDAACGSAGSRSRKGHLWPWWFAALLCVAGGVLTKWTAPAFFYGTAVPLLWWRGRVRLLWSRYHLFSAALAAAICLAWIAAAVVQAGWEPLYATVKREALFRLVPNYDPSRSYPWQESLLHPFRLLVTTLPWSLIALVTLWPRFARLWDERGRRLLVLLHCWTWPNILIWSWMTEHTPRHSFPLFPGIAGLATMVFWAWQRGKLNLKLARLRPQQVLVGSLICWLVLKAVFVHAVMPGRLASRQPRAKGELVAASVPASQILYVFLVKDEGIMFYYGRPVVRLNTLKQLPSSSEPLYCILNQVEWRQWDHARPAHVVLQMIDQQGDPIVLVRVAG